MTIFSTFCFPTLSSCQLREYWPPTDRGPSCATPYPPRPDGHGSQDDCLGAHEGEAAVLMYHVPCRETSRRDTARLSSPD